MEQLAELPREGNAALTPPVGTILHEQWVLTTTSTDPACTVKHGPNEISIDEAPPHTYRALVNDWQPDPVESGPCAPGSPAELGGAFDSGEALRFVPPDSLSVSPFGVRMPLDPVTDIRDAIGAGTAQDEGATQLDGRTVERIRIELPSGEPAYAYVDPHTFYPVEEECDCGSAGPITGLHVVIRYLTFEYLPRTGASLALTDIEAQHPNATTTG